MACPCVCMLVGMCVFRNPRMMRKMDLIFNGFSDTRRRGEWSGVYRAGSQSPVFRILCLFGKVFLGKRVFRFETRAAGLSKVIVVRIYFKIP